MKQGKEKMRAPGKKAVFLAYAAMLLFPLLSCAWRQQSAGAASLPAGGTAGAREDAGDVRKIALTFDDGPHPQWTPRLLDGLRERDVQATFFLIGMYAAQYPQIVERMDREGHLIGNHTYHHVRLDQEDAKEMRREIRDTDQAIYLITGKHTDYVRPPFGVWNEELGEEMEVLPILWTIDPLDWTTQDVGGIVEKVVTQAQDGAMILLHDCYGSSVEAALEIVDILKGQGFSFVTAEELVLP